MATNSRQSDSLHQLMTAGNVLAEVVEDLRPRSDPASPEAVALRAWENALTAMAREAIQ